MGGHFQTLVHLEATAAEAPVLAADGLAWLVDEGIVRAERTDCVLGAPLGHPPGPRWAVAVADGQGGPTDGLRIKTGRTVFHGGQGAAMFGGCPHCAARVDLYTQQWEAVDGAWGPFGAAIDAWYRQGHATVPCPRCGHAGDLTAWTWDDDYYAFGYLGFEFWNWPEFTPAFVERFAQALDGRPVRLVAGTF